MASDMANEDQRLTSAFRKYRAATGVDKNSLDAWQTTRELLQEVTAYRSTRSYGELVAGIKRCSGRTSESRVEEVLRAAKFACNRSALRCASFTEYQETK